MSGSSLETQELLTSIDMNPAQTDAMVFMRAFLNEMDEGLAGHPSSLRMLPTFLSTERGCEKEQTVIAIDAGGTNLRVALVAFQDGRPIVLREKKSAMPGSRAPVSAETFFAQLATEVLPFTWESGKIGFCFSYPTEIRPDGDGKVICLTKEVRVEGIEGRLIGQSLVDALRLKGASEPLSVAVLNDTTAGLLGGAMQPGVDGGGGLAGLVLGTGCNTCYFERGEKIKKLPHAQNMIVNCESGNFAKAFRGRADELVDAASENPGAYLFEKMLSGVYLGKVVTQESMLAAQAGLLSPAFSKLETPLAAQELDNFLRGQENRVAKLCAGDDREVLTQLIDGVFDRAAKLVCANVLALCIHCDGGISQQMPFTVVAEGSTFYQSLLLRKKLEAYCTELAGRECGRSIVFRRAENATLAGAAFAALTR